MTAKVQDIIAIVEGLAPRELAESWDNVGLQVGSRSWPVRRIWTALDPSLDVVTAACRAGADLLVTHHPLFFGSIGSIDVEHGAGRIAGMAIEHRLAIFSAHTNLDSAAGGVNDLLAEKIGLRETSILSGRRLEKRFKVVVTTPPEAESAVAEALFEAGAGVIGEYRRCSFRSGGTGTFFAGEGASPALGNRGEMNRVGEVRIETVVGRRRLAEVLKKTAEAHPYETPVIDVYPLEGGEPLGGLGRVGGLARPVRLAELARSLQERFATRVRVAGPPDLAVSRVAVCSGSGGSLVEDFLASGAEAYVTGDLKYHEARRVEEAGRGLVDIGHFASERIAVDSLRDRLERELRRAALAVTVESCPIERDPFTFVD